MQIFREEVVPLFLKYVSRLRVRFLHLWRRLVPPISRERKAEVQIQLRDTSEGDFDYYVLVVLSGIIATFGLLIDSPATIIGAMLVAPLMSPILGIGLASLRGDTKLLRNAAISLIRGAILAILLATVITWVNDRLPFTTLQDLPGEVLSRTRPSPIDLGVALAGGLAATFALAQPELSAALPGVAIATALMPPLCAVGVSVALGRWDAAAGALLLFLTNAVTIAASAIALFFALGFSPPRREGEGYIPRSLLISFGLTFVLLAPLGYQSYQFVQQATRRGQIEQVLRTEVGKLEEVDLVNPLLIEETGDAINIEITVRSLTDLNLEDSVKIRDALAAEFQKTIHLQINLVSAARLDPAIPPTPTPTPLPGVTVTATFTATPTRTPLPPSSTPTSSPSFTPTPALLILSNTFGEGVNLRSFPEGPSIGFLPEGARLTQLYGAEILNGWVWIEVEDELGRRGWIPQFYTQVITLTPSATPDAPLETQPAS